MHASYKMQIVPENGSLLNSRCTDSLAELNHTGETLSQRQYKNYEGAGACCSAAKVAAQVVHNLHTLQNMRTKSWAQATEVAAGGSEEASAKPVC